MAAARKKTTKTQTKTKKAGASRKSTSSAKKTTEATSKKAAPATTKTATKTSKKATSKKRAAKPATQSTAPPAAVEHTATASRPAPEKRSRTSKARLENLKSMLVERRQQLLDRAAERNQVFEIDAHGDLVDLSTDLSERELRMGMAEMDREALTAIDIALEKLHSGSYGFCVACGDELPVERLMAIPTATHCVPCQERVEAVAASDEEGGIDAYIEPDD